MKGNFRNRYHYCSRCMPRNSRVVKIRLQGNIVILVEKINYFELKYSSPVIPDAIFTDSLKKAAVPSLPNDSCFHAPEKEIELVEWNPGAPGKAHELLLDGEILLAGESLREGTDCTQAFQVSQNVAIEYCQPAVPPHVSEKVRRFFVPQSLDVLHEPFPELERRNVRCDRS